ncbi:MAG: phospholipase D-like domain-containing protein [Nitrosospira sp.]
MMRAGLVYASIVLATGFAILCVLNLSLGNKQIDKPLTPHHSVTQPSFPRMVGAVLTPELVNGNRIQTLLNGDQIFPAMLGALRDAKTSITFETYIYWSSSIGAEFEAAFADAARRGVQVKVLVDWIGGELAESAVERMQGDGVEVRLYNPPRWNTLGRFNNRTHRKLMVVDGRIGFIGGVGIADNWRGHAQDPQHWRGTHFQVEGPVVSQLQSAFIDNWLQTTGEALDSSAFLPPLEAAGASRAHVFSSSPRGVSKSMQLLYLMSITAAAHSIDLSAAYFIPDEVAIKSLVAAAKRGVRVRIIVPGRFMDKEVVRHASRAVWGPLLEAGVQIFEYQPTMFHCKVIVVDGTWVSLGSSNFDARSFSINDEANLNVYDPSFAAEQGAIFEHDLTHSRAVTLDGWRERPWTERALDSAAALVASQL